MRRPWAMLWRIGRELAVGLLVLVIFVTLMSGGPVAQILNEFLASLRTFWAE